MQNVPYILDIDNFHGSQNMMIQIHTNFTIHPFKLTYLETGMHAQIEILWLENLISQNKNSD